MLRAQVLFAVLFVAAPAPAQPKASALARARVLFDEAGELERQGHWRAAQDRLRAALRIRETPNLHYALAWALENDDKLSEARTEYVVALRLAHHAGNALTDDPLDRVLPGEGRVTLGSPRDIHGRQS